MISPEEESYIRTRVHQEYYGYDTNCAGTTILCLAHLLNYDVSEQTFAASLGMHGAGGYRAQCGLVEGTLMFLGMYFTSAGLAREEVIALCRTYAEAFEQHFGTLTCRKLRPQGFAPEQPPHMCEQLTCRSIMFSLEFIRSKEVKE